MKLKRLKRRTCASSRPRGILPSMTNINIHNNLYLNPYFVCAWISCIVFVSSQVHGHAGASGRHGHRHSPHLAVPGRAAQPGAEGRGLLYERALQVRRHARGERTQKKSTFVVFAQNQTGRRVCALFTATRQRSDRYRPGWTWLHASCLFGQHFMFLLLVLIPPKLISVWLEFNMHRGNVDGPLWLRGKLSEVF